ncbi:MAG TPA: type II secretion system F family protein [Candidatus Paceibacterota bacterium]|nr:type II secretion system F family protein [Verrucomicrobiota bacterium]HSA09954.1 type II secretion system F family protein [Candidatus Paceibacterota bacterium]
MPLFQYKALQANGAMIEGHLEASDRQGAFSQMAGLGLRPVSLSEKASTGTAGGFALPNSLAYLSFRKRSTKVSGRELENFTRLLSSLLAAGVPLSRALVILHKEAASPTASAKWKEIHDLVVDGMSLADSMGKSPETFPRVYTAMVQAGETGGFLDLVLAQIADFQAREKELRSKVLSAMLYPSILFVLAIGVLIFLLAFFIPRFQGIFRGFGAALPLVTQVVIGASNVVRGYGMFIAVGLVILVVLLRTWFTSEEGRRKWESLVLRTPVVGPLVAEFAMARFCRMLGTLLGAGVPLVQGLGVARKSIGNQILVDAVSQSIERVREGGQLGQSLGDAKSLFPSSVVEMISVAEESGRLDQELVRIANVTEADLDRELKTAVALMEPMMLFFIAAFIGMIFISMVLPIFTMQEYIK